MSSHKWIAHMKEKAGSVDNEIAVIQADFKHGFDSYGWSGSNKLIIFDTTMVGVPNKYRRVTHQSAFSVAESIAKELNRSNFTSLYND